MRNKFLILLFGLLLAVGWTSSAQAQRLPAKTGTMLPVRVTEQSIKNEASGHADGTWQPIKLTYGSDSKASLRSQNYNLDASVTHTKSWFEQELPNPYVTWDGGSQLITAPFTDVDGMMALVERVYTDKNIPGAKYSETWHCDIPYQTIEYGWNILGNKYEDIQIKFYSGYIDILGIRIKDGDGGVLYSWTAPQTNGASAGLPSSWTLSSLATEGASATLTQERVYSSVQSSYYYAYWMGDGQYGGGIITIPASYLNNLNNTTGSVSIEVSSMFTGSSPTTSNTAVLIGNETFDFVRDSAYSNGFYYSYPTYIPGTITPPDECGYTVLLVKLYDGKNQDGTPPYEALDYTHSKAELKNYFTEYIKEMDLLTDGLRDNTDNDNVGTVFAYTGDLSRFYFISKGKMSYTSSLETIELDLAPFYSMYEEFSPAVAGGSEDHTDFYTELRKGVTYPIVHDCQGVNYLQHYFSMSGKHGTDENHVNSLVLYIPDLRGNGNRWSRTYDTDHQPTVGMYMVDLFADIEPAPQDGFYQTTVNWEDNLDAITHSDGIPQTYYLYQVIGNDTICVTPNGTDQTTWNSADYGIYYEAGDAAYEIHYFVVATPTGATNPETFYAQSAPDNVTVPGTSDFIGLQWWRYESDYVTNNGEKQEVNYYRNWLAPHKLSLPGQAGISAGNVGTTGRTLTLYRGETPVIDLELVMNGNKAYYRIKYRSNQEIEPGYGEDGELIRNNNN